MPTDPTRTDLGPSGDGAAPPEAARLGVDAGDPAGEPGDAPRRRSRAVRIAAWTVGVVAALVVGVLLFLQTPPGQQFARGLVVGQIQNVFAEDAQVSAEGLSGSFLTGARLTGLTVARGGETVLAVDTVVVDYNLTTLLRRTFSASILSVRGLRLTVRQRADSTFNIAGLLRPAEDDKQQRPFAVVLDRVALTNGAADVFWYRADGRDSVHSVRDLAAVVRGFRMEGDSLSGDIEALGLRALAPFGRGEVELTAAGRFSKQQLDLRELAVTSVAGTDLTGRARLAFGTDGVLPVFDALIEGAPIALEDARAFAGVSLFGDPRVRLRVDSDGELLTGSLSGALGDATISLDGEFTRDPDGGPVRYRAEGSLQRFDPSVLTGNAAQAATVTGDLRINLQGTTLTTLSGPFNVALRESRVGGRTIDRLDVDGSFAAGRVTFNVRGALPGASLVAEGRARPFDEVPTVQVAGTAQNVDLGVLLPGSGRTDTFAGEFALLGRGASLDRFSGTLALDLDRAEIGLTDRRLRFGALQLDADIDRGLVAFDTDATLADGNGRIVALGTVRLGDPLAYEVAEGEAYGLNLAALTGKETQDSDLTGSFTLSGQGLDLTQVPVDLTARLTNSRFGTFNLAAADLDVVLRGGTATIDAALDFGPGGRLTAQGTARPFVDPLAYRLEGTMQNLDLAEVQGVPERYSDLTGTYTVDGAGLDPTLAVLDARVRITEPSSYGERFVDGADLAVSLNRGALTVEGDLVTPEGAFDLAFSGRPFDADPGYDFERACFTDLDVSRFAASAPRSDLAGCFSGRISGLADIATADGQGVVTLRRSRINDARIVDGRIAFRLRDGALDADLALTLDSPDADEGVAAGGRVVATFAGRPFDETPSYAIEGRTEGLDAGTLLDLPPNQPLRVSLTFDVSGRGFDPATMTLAGALRGGPSTLGPIGLDTLQTRFALADGVVAVDTLRLESDLADLTGSGTLALFNDAAPSAFHLEGRIESLAPIAAQTERTLGLERGTLVLDVSAEAGGPLRILGTAEARQLVVDDYALTGLDATLNAAYDRAAPDSLFLDKLDGALRAEFDVFSGPNYRVEKGQALVGFDDGTYTVDGSVLVDARRDLDFFARFDPTAEGVMLERGRFRLEGAEWSLLQPAEISLANGAIDVRGLLLASDDGARQVAADGVLDFEGEQNFVVTVQALPIDALTDFVSLEALGGTLTATLDLTGPAAAPRIDGVVQLDDLTSRGDRVGALAVDVAYADGRLALDAVLTHVDGETLTVDGTVPFQFSLADGPAAATGAKERVALVARADAFPIDWARPFLDGRMYSALGGALRLDLRIAGTQASPLLDGVATLSDGRLGIVKTGRVYEPIVADITFQNDRIVLDDVRILDAAGRTALDITGDVRLRELSVGEFDLTITPREFLAMDSRTYRGLVLDRGPQPLRLTGTIDRPVLRGSIVLSEGDIYLTDELVPPELEAVSLTDAQIREVEARFGRVVTARDTSTSRFVDALDYALTVEIEQDVWLRSKAGLPFDIEFAGDIEARKRAFAEGSQLFGRINLVRGSVETLNRQFVLQNGSLLFNGDPLSARVDLAATLDIRLPGSVAGQSSATITLSAEGRLDDNPTIRLSATPAMEAADIVSLIATGQLADDFVGTGALTGAGASLVLGSVTNQIEGLASRSLGIEMVQIDYEGGDLVLKVGDYFASRLFWTAGFIVPLGDSPERERRVPIVLTLDYELLRWLNAQAELSGQRGVGGGLDYELTW